MRNNCYREDDLLSDFGIFLQKQEFIILSLSGNQQGRYWFQMGKHRKAPDVIAVRNNLALVGEAKVRSRDLFRLQQNGVSDYQSLQYMLDNTESYTQLKDKILGSLKNLNISLTDELIIKAIVVGGNLFDTDKELCDKRIGAISVNKDNFVIYNCENIF